MPRRWSRLASSIVAKTRTKAEIGELYYGRDQNEGRDQDQDRGWSRDQDQDRDLPLDLLQTVDPFPLNLLQTAGPLP
nr:hypothetical protein CFP56_17475 [Quercus suber]